MDCGEAAGFYCDLSIDLSYRLVAAEFEEAVLVIEFGEPCRQGQLMPVELVDPESELPRLQPAGQHASGERSRGGFLAGLAGGGIEDEAELIERSGEQVVHVVVRLSACAGCQHPKSGTVQAGDERVTGSADDIACGDLAHVPESGAVL
ncbi:hypothetical protein VR46_27010 [Streptomyces sp. NRRL S-444]|nr:hypothetical protein VR46_27010 [Streptomyces sp. NRRL S-444]